MCLFGLLFCFSLCSSSSRALGRYQVGLPQVIKVVYSDNLHQLCLFFVAVVDSGCFVTKY